MKKIVFVNQSPHYLTVDIVNVFAKKYDNVILIYGDLDISSRNISSSVEKKKIISYNRKTIISRFFTWSVATIQIFFQLIKYKKYKIFFFSNPPLSYLLASFFKLDYSIIVFDIYPDSLKNFGIKKNHFIYKWWAKQNIKVFSKAKAIFTLSEGMCSCLKQYGSEEKIHVVPIWSDSDKYKPVPKEQNIFLKSHNLEDKFIILYSGNIGFTHNVETIIELAKELSNYSDIFFLIIGDGGKKTILQKHVLKYELNNCLFLDWQPSNISPYSLSCGDIGVVTINEDNSLLSVPSKTFNLMATGTPLLCIAPQNSELSFLVNEYKNGECFDKSQLHEMKSFILEIRKNKTKREKMREASLAAIENYTSKNAELFYYYVNNPNYQENFEKN